MVVAVPTGIVDEAFLRRAMMDSILPHIAPGLGRIVSPLILSFAYAIWGIVTKRLARGLKVMIAAGSIGARRARPHTQLTAFLPYAAGSPRYCR